MSTKINDWFAVTLNSNETNLGENPYATLNMNGITPDNTDLKDEDFYRNIPQVQEKFTKNGEFNEALFQQAYQSAQRTFTEFAEIDYTERLLNAFGTTPYDSSIISHPEKHVNHYQAVLTPFHDKNRSTYGTGNIWETGSPTFSDREVAQANYVRDEDGNVLDWTPNDKAKLFKNLFTPALAYASYDEDVYDENGKLIHQKGELKLDAKGDPYTELLGHREAYGKDIVKWSDNLTVEGTFWNKIDVFDSDGLDKSITKTVAETAIMLLPYFTPIAPYWGYANAAMGLAKAAPVLLKSLNGIFTNNNDSEYGKNLTWMENIMGRFHSSQSDAAKGKFFSSENIGDIIVSSANQLFSQRQIANLAGKWKPFTSAEANKKFAQNLSLGYMSLTSATESYGRFKEAGADDWMAGLGSILTMGAFYTLMNQGYFKNKLFENTWLDEDIRTVKNLSEITTHAAERMFGNVSTVSKETVKKGLPKLWDKIKKGVAKLPKGYAYESHSIMSRSINEGVEETMEEVVQDAITALAKGLEMIGINCTGNTENLDFGWNLAEASKRYGASFMGGLLGGAVFEINTQWNLYKDPNYKKMLNSPPVRKMFYDIMQGHGDKYRNAIRLQGSKKLNGNYNLSATPELITGADGKVTQVYKAGTEKDNQNLAVTNALLQMVDNAEDICRNHNLIWSDSDLLKQVLETESVKEFLQETSQSKEDFIVNGLKQDHLATEAIINGLLDLTIEKDGKKISIGQAVAENVLYDVNHIRQEIFDKEIEIQEKLSQFPVTDLQTQESRDKLIKNNAALKALSDQKKKLMKQYAEIIEGTHADHFLTQILMFFNQDLRDTYLGLGQDRDGNRGTKNIQNYSQFVFHVDYDTLEDGDDLKKVIQDDYESFIKKQENWLRKIADLHVSISENSADILRKTDGDLQGVSHHKNYLFQQQKITVKDFIDRMDEEDKKAERIIEQFRNLGLVDPNDDPKLKAAIEMHEMIRRVRPNYQSIPGEMNFEAVFNTPEMIEGDNDTAIAARLDFVQRFYEEAIANKNIGVDDSLMRKMFAEWGLNSSETLKYIKDELTSGFYNVRPLIDQFGWTYEQAIEFIENDGQVTFVSPDNIDEGLGIVQDILIEAVDQFKTFSQSIKTIENLFKSNPRKALESVQNLILELSKTREDGTPVLNLEPIIKSGKTKQVDSVESFIHWIFNPGRTNDPINAVIALSQLIDSTQPSPLIQLIQDLSEKLLGERSRIFDIIEKEKANVQYSSIEKYLLSKAAEKELRDAEGLLNIISGLIEGSLPGNINELINTKRGEKPFTIVSENTAQILKIELDFVKKQIAAFKRISEINKGNRIAENKNIAKYDSVRRFMKFMEPDGIIKDIETKLGITFSDFASKTDWPTEKEELEKWTDEEYDKFYVVESEFKNKLHTWLTSKTDEEQKSVLEDLGTIAASCTSNIDEFTADLDIPVGDWGNIRYLLSNFATSFSEFQGLYKSAVDKLQNFLPFYPQEFVIRDAFSAYEKQYLYNVFLNALYKETLEKASDADFVKTMAVIENFFFINGIPGSGKSSACAKILVDVLKTKYPDLEVIGLVQDPTRLKPDDPDSFGNVIGIPQDHCFTTDSFIENYVYQGISEDKRGNDRHSSTKLNYNNINLTEFRKNFTGKRVLFLMDESTFTNETQFKVFSNFVGKIGNSTIIGLGDFYQSGSEAEFTDITDVFTQSSIRLTSGFRSTNNGKLENERNARGILRTALDVYHRDVSTNEVKLDEMVYNSLDVFTKKPLIGYVDNNGLIYGDVHRQSSDIGSIIRTLKEYYASEEKTPSICIITENPSKYDSYVEEGIDVKTARAAQGGQWDYVISDYNFAFSQDFCFSKFKQFYTIMTRAKNGTVWTGAIGNVEFSETEDATTVVGKDLSSDEIRAEYIAWRKHLFGLIDTTIPSTNPINPPTVVPDDGPPVSDDSAAKILDLYTPATTEEVEEFRRRLYEMDTDDPEIIRFRELHKTHVENYQKRQKSLETNGLDFDSWFKWLDEEKNLFEKGPFLVGQVDSEAFKKYLLYTSEIIAECLLDGNNIDSKLAIFRNKYGNPSSPFARITNDICSRIKNDEARIQLRQVGIDNGRPLNILYLTYNNNNGNPVALPIWANHDEVTNCSYELSALQTKVVSKPIPISSMGEKYTDFDSVSGKVQLMDRVMIFKGVPEGTKMTKEQEEFNRRNKGKAFILVETVTGNSAYDEWDSFFNIKYNSKGEIDKFISDGKLYVSLVGVQRKCTTENLITIFNAIHDAYVAAHDGKYEEYEAAVNAVKNIVGEDFSVRGWKQSNGEYYHGFDESATYTENSLFSSTAATYVLNRLYRHYDQPLVTINSALNSARKTISLDCFGTGIYVYRDDDNNLRLTLNEKPRSSDPIITDIEVDNISTPFDYLVNLFTRVISENWSAIKGSDEVFFNNFVAIFKLPVRDGELTLDINGVQNHLKNLLSEHNRNGAYTFNFRLGYIPNVDEIDQTFIESTFGHMLMGWNLEDEVSTYGALRSFIESNITLFKNDLIHLNVFADDYKKNDKEITWGWTDRHGSLGYGWDLVDILPTSYSMEVHGNRVDSIVDFGETISNEGNITIGNRFAKTDTDVVNLGANNVVVDRNWLINNTENPAIPNGDSFTIISVNKNGNIVLKGHSITLKLKDASLQKLLSEFKNLTLGYNFNLDGNRLTYLGSTVQKVLGFSRTKTPSVYLVIDNKVVEVKVNDVIVNRLSDRIVFQDDIVKVISNGSIWDIITVGNNGYKRFNDVVNTNIQISSFIVDDTILDPKEIEYWDKRYQLTTSYSNFKNIVKNGLELNAPNANLEKEVINEILEILEKETSIGSALTLINNLLSEKKYELGVGISFNDKGMKAPNVKEHRQIYLGHLAFEYLQRNGINNTIINVENDGKSPNFSVYLQSGEKLDFEWDENSDINLITNADGSDDYVKAFENNNIRTYLETIGITDSDSFREIADKTLINALYKYLRNVNDEDGKKLVKNLLKTC